MAGVYTSRSVLHGGSFRTSCNRLPDSEPLSIYLPYVQHPRPLSCREAGITSIGRVVHIIMDRIWPTIALSTIRIWSSGAVIACGETAVGTGVFACWAAGYLETIVSMIFPKYSAMLSADWRAVGQRQRPEETGEDAGGDAVSLSQTRQAKSSSIQHSRITSGFSRSYCSETMQSYAADLLVLVNSCGVSAT